MKNFGISVFDITNLQGALRISLGGVWVEDTGFEYGRSLLSLELKAESVMLDAFFIRFVFKR